MQAVDIAGAEGNVAGGAGSFYLATRTLSFEAVQHLWPTLALATYSEAPSGPLDARSDLVSSLRRQVTAEQQLSERICSAGGWPPSACGFLPEAARRRLLRPNARPEPCSLSRRHPEWEEDAGVHGPWQGGGKLLPCSNAGAEDAGAGSGCNSHGDGVGRGEAVCASAAVLRIRMRLGVLAWSGDLGDEARPAAR
jgi:hypothetical protein